jgi:hypothetical protein
MRILYSKTELKSRNFFGYVTHNSQAYFATKEKYFLTSKQRCPIIYNMKEYQKKPWTHDERNLLRNEYYFKNEKELLEMFPGRSMNSIRKQVSYLRKRGWCFIRKGAF